MFAELGELTEAAESRTSVPRISAFSPNTAPGSADGPAGVRQSLVRRRSVAPRQSLAVRSSVLRRRSSVARRGSSVGRARLSQLELQADDAENGSPGCAGEPKLRQAHISYPLLPPILPAFGIIEFAPVVRVLQQDELSWPTGDTPLPGEVPPPSFRYSVEPALPPKVELDPLTGVLSGSPLLHQAAAQEFLITAQPESPDAGVDVAQCTIRFAVAPAEIADLCAAAFHGLQAMPLGPESAWQSRLPSWHSRPPSSARCSPPPPRSVTPGVASQVRSPSPSPEDVMRNTSPSPAFGWPLRARSAQSHGRSLGQSRLPHCGSPHQRPASSTDFHMPRLLSARPGRQMMPRAPDGGLPHARPAVRSRKSVFPLGPPLQNRKGPPREGSTQCRFAVVSLLAQEE